VNSLIIDQGLVGHGAGPTARRHNGGAISGVFLGALSDRARQAVAFVAVSARVVANQRGLDRLPAVPKGWRGAATCWAVRPTLALAWAMQGQRRRADMVVRRSGRHVEAACPRPCAWTIERPKASPMVAEACHRAEPKPRQPSLR